MPSMHGANMPDVKINQMKWRDTTGSEPRLDYVCLTILTFRDLSGDLRITRWWLYLSINYSTITHLGINSVRLSISFSDMQFRTAESGHLPCHNGLVHFMQTELAEIEEALPHRIEGFQSYPAFANIRTIHVDKNLRSLESP